MLGTLLTVLHLVVVTPLGRLSRTAARRRRELGLDRDAPTYWEPSDPYASFPEPALTRVEREWAAALELPDAWDVPAELVRYPLGVRWSHPDVCPCDEHGFRIPPGFASQLARAAAATGRPVVACLGGSTTLGRYCDYEGTYPHELERILGDTVVLNLGLNGLEATGELHLLVDLLRWGVVPAAVVFLDGINEKQGWLQAGAGDPVYRETSNHYEAIRALTEPPQRRLGVRRRRDAWTYRAEFDPFAYVADQAAVYTGAHAAARRVCEAWGVRHHAFLQPTVWDVWAGGGKRHDYLKALYRSILARTEGKVVDLSADSGIEPEMFIDWQHVDAAGNRVLAARIARELAA